MKARDYFKLGVPHGPAMAAAREVAGAHPNNASELIQTIASDPDNFVEHESHQVRTLANWIRFERNETLELQRPQ